MSIPLASPSINDARLGWGLSIEDLHHLLQADPATWLYCEPGLLAEGSYAVVYGNIPHTYYHCWVFDAEEKMQDIRLMFPADWHALRDAFLAGSYQWEDRYLYRKEALHVQEPAPMLFLQEPEEEGLTQLLIRFHEQERTNYEAPTISAVRFGWGLPLEELQRLLADSPEWEYHDPTRSETGEHREMRRHARHGYFQSWDYDAEGKMEETRLYIPAQQQHLVGAFLLGGVPFGEEWWYPGEGTAYKTGIRLRMQEIDSATHLRITLQPLK